ncbi:MAG: hypothetical protein NT024_06925 [Proteobacteria bacterium]|nr:hypothetical protein [Pseudomonadota bacterium]
MAIDRIADYRVFPPSRGPRERDNKKAAKRQGAIEPQTVPVRSEASRRTLIHSARNQLDAGAPMDRLTVELGLRRDELCLMDIGRRAGAAPSSS